MKNFKFGLVFVLFWCISVVKAQQNACACCSENHNAFDFWVGEWIVTNTDGSEAGLSVISEIENGCVIKENWTSIQVGYTGTSYNFYNSKLKRWEQLWVDNQGQYLKLYGQKVGNQMILESDEFEAQNGEILVNRITWTSNEDGTVRQHWEVLKEGEVNKTLFDGSYTRKK
ncbi:hypothetical protein [Croceivirga thetidis]|uniref:Uncharacterized protein n=1 Tax=Croceivirga thetidis TaxID=2721623 RepID=A0ABX1GWB5_9FLAO|nr:hypothetical protein [Croceivirga thetidis]NKI33012.1 hypothetical protein [Croceivirga thetidis]